jgi:hypothetical protein
MIERYIVLLNLLSALILVVAGLYVQIAFATVLTTGIDVAIGVLVTGYFLVTLDAMIRRQEV